MDTRLERMTAPKRSAQSPPTTFGAVMAVSDAARMLDRGVDASLTSEQDAAIERVLAARDAMRDTAPAATPARRFDLAA